MLRRNGWWQNAGPVPRLVLALILLPFFGYWTYTLLVTPSRVVHGRDLILFKVAHILSPVVVVWLLVQLRRAIHDLRRIETAS